jgi:hypothetical protein
MILFSCILVPYMKKAFLYEGVNCHTRTDHNCREQLSSVTREHGWPSLPLYIIFRFRTLTNNLNFLNQSKHV